MDGDRTCDYCNEKKSFLIDDVQYYNFGFKKRELSICTDCREDKTKGVRLFLTSELLPDLVYEEICNTIRTESDRNPGVNFYDAVRLAYRMNGEVKRYLQKRDVKDEIVIDKNLRSLWEYTFKISNNLDSRIRVIDRNPDNFLVTWFNNVRA
jgi:hypothetical protein